MPSGKPFDPAAARAALDALAPTLAGCKLPKGRSDRIKLTFAPDGNVSSATVLPPVAPQGACVATRLKEARVAPFKGPAASYVYTFAGPR
jgi:hypothetical protein